MTTRVVQRAAKGFVLTAGASLVKSVVHLAVLVILGRLLSPNDFGIVAAALVFGKLADILAYMGSGQVVVQRKDLSDDELRVANTLGAGSGLFFAFVCLVSSSALGSAMGIPELGPVLKVYSVVFILKGFGVVPGAYLLRQGRFGDVAACNIAADLSLGIVSVGMGFGGYGVWALVSGYIAWAATYATMVQWRSSTPYQWSFHGATVRSFFSDSVGFSGGMLANYAANQGDYFWVARALGSSALGVYERAYQIMSFPVTLAGAAADKVLFSLMSRLQHVPTKVYRAVRATNALAVTILAPLSGVVIVVAPELIRLLLGPGWEGAVQPLRIMAVVMAFRSSYRLFDAHTRSAGAIFARARRQVVYATLVFTGAMIGVRFGLAVVATFVSGAIFANYVLMARLTSTVAEESSRNILLDIGRPLMLAVVVVVQSIVTASILRFQEVHDLVTLAVVATVALACWGGALRLLGRRILGHDNFDLLLDYFSSIKPARAGR